MPLSMSSLSFETLTIHAGQDPKQRVSKDIVAPISLATTYQQDFPNDASTFHYSRTNNPTRACLEACLAPLEKARYALCYASGLAAVDNFLHLFKTGDHIVASDNLYGGVHRLLKHCAMPLGFLVDFVDATDITKVTEATKSTTKIVWVETPSNPLMKLVDIRGLCKAVKAVAPDAVIVVDNTFMTPTFQKPLVLGADVAMHSISKYLNGHSDVVMGCLMTSHEELHKRLRFMQNSVGAVPSPFDCYLVCRGLKTLAVRMQRHCENGLKVARRLEMHPSVLKVLHPGLPSHPQYELARNQCSGFSGMLSFYIKGGEKAARVFLQSLKLFALAESLGAVESLAGFPAMMSHASLTPEEKTAQGITDNLIRLSVGIENADDLMDDIEQALDAAANA